MLKVIKYSILMGALWFLASCTEFYTPAETGGLSGFSLTRHQADIMVGDTLFLQPVVTDDISTATLKWWIDEGDQETAEVIGRKVTAKKAGLVRVKVSATAMIFEDSVAVEKTITDTCLIRVLDWAAPPEGSYPFETIVIANLSVEGIDFTANLGEFQLVATVNGSTRAVAVPKSKADRPYLFFRISSDDYGEQARFECYSATRHKRVLLNELILDGETHGTLQNPWQLHVESWDQ